MAVCDRCGHRANVMARLLDGTNAYRCPNHMDDVKWALGLTDDDAHARISDPETSLEAAESLRREKIRRSQMQVYEALLDCGPMCDTRLQEALAAEGIHMSPSGVRTRRSELVEKNMVEDSGKRTVLFSGRRSIIWRVKE